LPAKIIKTFDRCWALKLKLSSFCAQGRREARAGWTCHSWDSWDNEMPWWHIVIICNSAMCLRIRLALCSNWMKFLKWYEMPWIQYFCAPFNLCVWPYFACSHWFWRCFSWGF
jgi:hypothetical protein